MTQDEIIEMAREAGWPDWEIVSMKGELKAFAKLVAAKAFPDGVDAEWIARRTKYAVEQEREACHALRQTLPNPHTNCQVSAHAYDMAIVEYGRAIRARGKA